MVGGAVQEARRRGWFAAMYRQVTTAGRDHVVAGRFDDAATESDEVAAVTDALSDVRLGPI